MLATHYAMVPISRKNKKMTLISDILAYIDAHCTEQITLESLSREFGYNKSYFSRLFNGYIGTSLSNYVNFVKLNRYEELIASNPTKKQNRAYL